MERFKERLTEYAALVEEALSGYLYTAPMPEQTVLDAMGYSLLGGGKRIRGVLTLAFCRLLGGEERDALPFAGALEMIHAYSLIHDDLPCMDDDDLRRGKPACHIAHGEATALLAGDGLLTLAFETLSDSAHTGHLPPARVVEGVRCLSTAAGCGGMIGGQVIDLAQEGKDTPPDLLRRLISKKTGALLRASGQLGCIAAGANREQLSAVTEYCDKVGLAFQIVDDILDITGDAAVLGKPIGSDAESHKSTWVTVFGVDQARRDVENLGADAKAALGQLEGDTSFLSQLADYLAGRSS